jgi:hypothetical protein
VVRALRGKFDTSNEQDDRNPGFWDHSTMRQIFLSLGSCFQSLLSEATNCLCSRQRQPFRNNSAITINNSAIPINNSAIAQLLGRSRIKRRVSVIGLKLFVGNLKTTKTQKLQDASLPLVMSALDRCGFLPDPNATKLQDVV